MKHDPAYKDNTITNDNLYGKDAFEMHLLQEMYSIKGGADPFQQFMDL